MKYSYGRLKDKTVAEAIAIFTEEEKAKHEKYMARLAKESQDRNN